MITGSQWRWREVRTTPEIRVYLLPRTKRDTMRQEPTTLVVVFPTLITLPRLSVSIQTSGRHHFHSIRYQ